MNVFPEMSFLKLKIVQLQTCSGSFRGGLVTYSSVYVYSGSKKTAERYRTQSKT